MSKKGGKAQVDNGGDHCAVDESGVPIKCQWCHSMDVPSLRRCARCRKAYYCCKEHQKRHWKTHKPYCIPAPNQPQQDQANATNNGHHNVGEAAAASNAVNDIAQSNDHVEDASQSTTSAEIDDMVQIGNNVDGSKDASQPLTQPPNAAAANWPEWASKTTTTSHCLGLRQQSASNAGRQQQLQQTSAVNPHATISSIPWLQQICQNVVSDMNNYGICVMDAFLGEERGNAILKEVMQMYEHGSFTEGQLVNSKVRGPSHAIRGDRITWVHGTESECQNVGFLIQTLDSVITTCTAMNNNGLLGQVKIQRHTKAMIACYPGNGTHYVKHVDNPNGDGRCVTSIYYLNKNWEPKHAGKLRIFPSNYQNQVAEIEPIFDRIVFFWSDRRNPHEVEPSYALRFAITVWYFDDDERNKAIEKYQQEAKKPEL